MCVWVGGLFVCVCLWGTVKYIKEIGVQGGIEHFLILPTSQNQYSDVWSLNY